MTTSQLLIVVFVFLLYAATYKVGGKYHLLLLLAEL